MKYKTAKNILYAVILVVVVLVLYFWWGAKNSGASEKVNICHYDGRSGNYQTLNISKEGANAHLEEHDNDYKGECKTENRWVKKGHEKVGECTGKCESYEGTQSHAQAYKCEKFNVGEDSEGGDDCKEGEKTVKVWEEECRIEEPPACEVSPTPSPEPTPTEEVKREFGPASAPQAPACEAPDWAPTITEVGRIDSDTVYAKWTEVADYVNTYVVWYGLSEDNLPWNTKVQGEYVELSGNELVGKHVWLKVAGEHEACAGPYSVVTDP